VPSIRRPLLLLLDTSSPKFVVAVYLSSKHSKVYSTLQPDKNYTITNWRPFIEYRHSKYPSNYGVKRLFGTLRTRNWVIICCLTCHVDDILSTITVLQSASNEARIPYRGVDAAYGQWCHLINRKVIIPIINYQFIASVFKFGHSVQKRCLFVIYSLM
jgi:hypothetical protein